MQSSRIVYRVQLQCWRCNQFCSSHLNEEQQVHIYADYSPPVGTPLVPDIITGVVIGRLRAGERGTGTQLATHASSTDFSP